MGAFDPRKESHPPRKNTAGRQTAPLTFFFVAHLTFSDPQNLPKPPKTYFGQGLGVRVWNSGLKIGQEKTSRRKLPNRLVAKNGLSSQ